MNKKTKSGNQYDACYDPNNSDQDLYTGAMGVYNEPTVPKMVPVYLLNKLYENLQSIRKSIKKGKYLFKWFIILRSKLMGW